MRPKITSIIFTKYYGKMDPRFVRLGRHMSKPRDQMIAALRDVVVPVLRDMGFSGSFPHFRRIRESQIDLLTFQFNRYGGSFVVEAACCASEGFTTHWGEHIPPQKVQT